MKSPVEGIESAPNNADIIAGIFRSFHDDPTRFGTIITFYGIVVVLSLVGNLLVLRTVVLKCARNSTNYLILNLAISDILMTVMNIPITVIYTLLHDWPFGPRLCVLVPFFQACCVYVSSFTMLTIALNRYYLVYYSRSKTATYLKPAGSAVRTSLSVQATDALHSRLRRPSAIQTLARGLPSKLWSLPMAIWAVAVLHSLPFANNNIIKNETTNHLRGCVQADTPFDELTLTIFAFITQYLLPLVISGAIYLRIGITISRLGQVLHSSVRVRRAAGMAPSSCSLTTNRTLTTSFSQRLSSISSEPATALPNTENGLLRRKAILVRKRRRILLLTMIVTIFAGCWLPFHAYFLLKDLHVIRRNEHIFMMFYWLAMSSVCYNPIVYFWLNDSFRNEVKSLLSRFCDFRCGLFQ